MTQPLRPPFTTQSARAKVQKAEDAWNTLNPDIVTQAYSEDSHGVITTSSLPVAKPSRHSSTGSGLKNFTTA